MKNTLELIVLALGAVALSSCYNRFTGNYNEFPDIHDSNSAIVATTSLSDKEIERRNLILKGMNDEPPPVYRINAGDSLSIVVYNHADLNMKTVVTPDGCIGMVFVGQLKVQDMTLPEAAKAIEDTLSEYIKNPSVAITPNEIRSETVTISGAVDKPGIYSIHDGMRLADLYALAGGSSVRRFD